MLATVQEKITSLDPPAISIIVITYNHRNFIEQCLNSILSQKTSLPVELIIYDDASTDETYKIVDSILDIESPNYIRLFQKENQMSKGQKIAPIVLEKAKGKYIFLVDGDDYWAGSPLRLQEMVERMEILKGLSFCFTDTIRFSENNSITKSLLPDNLKRNYISQYDLRTFNYSFLNVGACCFRNFGIKFPPEFQLQSHGDLLYPYLWGAYGPATYVPNAGTLMYRYNGLGQWSQKSAEERAISKMIYACQSTAIALKEGNIDAAISNSSRFLPLLVKHPRLKLLLKEYGIL